MRNADAGPLLINLGFRMEAAEPPPHPPQAGWRQQNPHTQPLGRMEAAEPPSGRGAVVALEPARDWELCHFLGRAGV